MDVITQDTVTEALDDMERLYKSWLTMRAATDAEKELAKEKLKKIDHARTQLTKLMGG